MSDIYYCKRCRTRLVKLSKTIQSLHSALAAADAVIESFYDMILNRKIIKLIDIMEQEELYLAAKKKAGV